MHNVFKKNPMQVEKLKIFGVDVANFRLLLGRKIFEAMLNATLGNFGLEHHTSKPAIKMNTFSVQYCSINVIFSIEILMEGSNPEIREKASENLDEKHFYYQILDFWNHEFDARFKPKNMSLAFSSKRVKC